MAVKASWAWTIERRRRWCARGRRGPRSWRRRCRPGSRPPGADLAGGGRGLLGQAADLLGDDREAAAVLAGARRLDGRVQGQQVGLVGDLGDRRDDAGDAVGLDREALDGLGDARGRLAHLVHRAGRLGDDLRAAAGGGLRVLGGLGRLARAGGALAIAASRHRGGGLARRADRAHLSLGADGDVLGRAGDLVHRAAGLVRGLGEVAALALRRPEVWAQAADDLGQSAGHVAQRDPERVVVGLRRHGRREVAGGDALGEVDHLALVLAHRDERVAERRRARRGGREVRVLAQVALRGGAGDDGQAAQRAGQRAPQRRRRGSRPPTTRARTGSARRARRPGSGRCARRAGRRARASRRARTARPRHRGGGGDRPSPAAPSSVVRAARARSTPRPRAAVPIASAAGPTSPFKVVSLVVP